ncbi:MAG: glycolate oxidase subunit GlcE [Methylococcaceae bacterium]
MDRLVRDFTDRIREAEAGGGTLGIQGHGSRSFLCPSTAPILSTRHYQGVVTYEPEELFITVRAGTPLPELEDILDSKGQYLAFEPLRFGAGGTVGGMVAAGLSGPRRMRSGPIRDYILGIRILDGLGRELRFGGTVIKNVAGYDVSRLFAGSWGRLGLILDVTLKVLPKPRSSLTLVVDIEQEKALNWFKRARSQPWPLGASLFQGHTAGQLALRLEAGPEAVKEAFLAISKELPVKMMAPEEAEGLWRSLSTHRHAALQPDKEQAVPLWRFSLPPGVEPLAITGELLIEWHGGLRWWRGLLDPEALEALTHGHPGGVMPFDAHFASRNLSGQGTHQDKVRGRLDDGVLKVFDPFAVFSSG